MNMKEVVCAPLPRSPLIEKLCPRGSYRCYQTQAPENCSLSFQLFNSVSTFAFFDSGEFICPQVFSSHSSAQ